MGHNLSLIPGACLFALVALSSADRVFADGPRVVCGGVEVTLDNASIQFWVENDFDTLDGWGDAYTSARDDTSIDQRGKFKAVVSLLPGLTRGLARLRATLHADFEVVKAPDATVLSDEKCVCDITADVAWLGVMQTFTVTTPVGVSLAYYFTNVEAGVRHGHIRDCSGRP